MSIKTLILTATLCMGSSAFILNGSDDYDGALINFHDRITPKIACIIQRVMSYYDEYPGGINQSNPKDKRHFWKLYNELKKYSDEELKIAQIIVCEKRQPEIIEVLSEINWERYRRRRKWTKPFRYVLKKAVYFGIWVWTGGNGLRTQPG